MYIELLCGSRSWYTQYIQAASRQHGKGDGWQRKLCVRQEVPRLRPAEQICAPTSTHTSHKIVFLQWTFGREVSAVRARWRVFRQNSLRPGSEDPPLNPPANKVPGQWRPFNNTWPHATAYNTETHSTSIYNATSTTPGLNQYILMSLFM